MNRSLLSVLAGLPLSACLAGPAAPPALSPSPAPAPSETFQLVSIGDRAAGAPAFVRFPADGTVTGRAPCNSFSASLLASWPEFRTGPMRVTRMACPDMGPERDFFQALSAMTRATLTPAGLVLTGPDGLTMVFQASRG